MDIDTLVHLVAQRQRVEEQIRASILDAREHGQAWSDIAAALGVTKQAAQQRYTDRAPLTCAEELEVGDSIEVKAGQVMTVASVVHLPHSRLRAPVRVTWDDDGRLWERDYPRRCLFKRAPHHAAS